MISRRESLVKNTPYPEKIIYLCFEGMICSLHDQLWAAQNLLCKLAAGTFNVQLKVARYSFSRSIPPKFERKLRRHKQRFGKIDTTVVLDKDENLLWSGLQWHRSCHSNEMTPLPIILAALFLTVKSFLGTFSSNSRLDVREVKTESVRALRRYFGIKFLSLEIR